MKNLRLFVFAISLISMSSAFAQSPASFNYQAAVRNAAGNILSNQSVGLRFSIHDGSAGGSVVYQETQTKTTNTFGLVNTAVGSGTVVLGTFAGITWGTGAKYLQVEIDPAGGSAYTDMGATQMLSVPYALYAANGGTAGPTGPQGPTGPGAGATGATGPTGPAGAGSVSGTTNYVAKFTPNGTSVGNSAIYENTGNIGIGTLAPNAKLNVVGGGNPMNIDGTAGMYVGIYEGGAYKGYFGSYSGAADDIDFGTGAGSNAKTHLVTRATPRLTIDTVGNVGIGTMSPNTRLHVVSTTSSNPMNIDGTASMYVGIFEGGVYKGYFGSYSGAADDIDFGTGSGSVAKTHIVTGATPRLTVDKDGNVGIGTTAPISKLDVTSASTTNPGIHSTMTSPAGAGYLAAILGENQSISGNGIGVYGSHAGSGWGVYGSSSSGYGVFGNSTSSTGIYGSSSSGTGGYFSSSTGNAVEVAGPMKMSGANKSAFTVTAPGGSYIFNIPTTVASSSTDIVIVTHSYVGAYITDAIGVWWNGSAWTIFDEKGSGNNIPAGEKFNVLVIKQ